MKSIRHDKSLVGEYGETASGPIIYLVLKSSSSAKWLQSLFLDVADSEEAVDLVSQVGVDLRNIEYLELRRDERHGTRSLAKKKGGMAFSWSCSQEEWETNALLVEPFTKGESGHQYLTSQGVDDALIEISFGEGNPFSE